MMIILFIDKIVFASLLRIIVIGRSIELIQYFEPLEISAKRWLYIFRKFGLIRAEIRQIEHHIGHVRNEADNTDIVRLRGYAWSICVKIRQEQLVENPLIKVMGKEWSIGKILLYFVKLVESDVRTECLRIGLVEWILKTKLTNASSQCFLLIERGQWHSYLESHAQSQGIHLIAYRQLWDLGAISKIGAWCIRAFRKMLTVLKNITNAQLRRLAVLGHSHDANGDPAIKQQLATSTIAIRYGHRKLSFDPTERSEFFWLNGSKIPYAEVLLYGVVADKPLDTKTLEQINEYGVRLLGQGPGIPTWLPTRQMLKVLLRTVLKLFFGLLSCVAHGHWVSLYYINRLVKLAVNFAYWYDFYAANQVRVNVGTLHTSVGQVLALDALDGVSVAYQYSASINLAPTTLLSAGEDVQLVFSPVFEQQWRRIGAPVGSYVHTGFIYDSALQVVRGLTRVAITRKQLQNNGARFILCFFDENTVNRWDIIHWDDETADDYEYLLKWLLDDPTLGIVFKPKKATTLFQRIDRVSGLLDQAMKTGRCKFLTSDTNVGSIYPAEAALVADVSIGLLGAETAALESQLAGCPTVQIDVIGYDDHPFHAWGRDRVVFDDWDTLRAAVEEYRASPQEHPEFGDWSPGIDTMDPFRDGQATLRMGSYIQWVYDALQLGSSQQAALAIAGEKFTRRWGADHIVMSNSVTNTAVKIAGQLKIKNKGFCEKYED